MELSCRILGASTSELKLADVQVTTTASIFDVNDQILRASACAIELKARDSTRERHQNMQAADRGRLLLVCGVAEAACQHN